jgi:hypothetical protein
MNWEEACQTLGVPVTATPAEIRTQYMYKAQLLHPDKTLGLPDQARQKAEQELKIINAAYDVLKNQKNNTVATPPKLKVSPRNIRFTEVRPGQQKTTRIQIENIGGPYTKFWMADSPVPWLKIVEVKSTTNDPLPLEVAIEATGSGTSQKHQCNLPIRIENEKTRTKDEVAIKIEMQESKGEPHQDPDVTRPPITRRFALSDRTKTLSFTLIPMAIGLIIYAYLKSLIPFWILLSFATLYLTEKWFGYPVRKHKTIGVFYRLVLNLGILFYLGFMVWTAVKLFSHHFMPTPLAGSLVFLGEFLFLIWIWIIVGRNSWRWPSMKLTIVTLIAVFLVFAFSGVQPFTRYKDDFFNHFSPTSGSVPQSTLQPPLSLSARMLRPEVTTSPISKVQSPSIPVLMSPADKSVFDFFPRTLTLGWDANEGTVLISPWEYNPPFCLD